MIKSKGIFAVSFIAMMVVGGAYANIASQGYVDQEVGKRLSTVNTTGTGDVVTAVSANNETGVVTVERGKTMPTKTSDLTNDSGFITAAALPEEYTLPAATATALGGVKSGGDITVAADGAVTVNSATNADSATKATQDAAGNVIADTYATKAEIPDEITVDTALSAESTNPVQNKVVKAALDKKLENTATGTGSLSTGGAVAASGTSSVLIGQNAGLTGAEGTSNVAIGYEAAGSANGAATAVGRGAAATGEGGVALGAFAESSGSAEGLGIAIGMGANANSSIAVGAGAESNLPGSVALGDGASATSGSTTALGGGATAAKNNDVAVGFSSSATGGSSLAVGTNAVASGVNAIQLGSGTNANNNTFQVRSYQMLDENGKIPDERMPDTVLTNTATDPNSFAVGGADAGTYQGAVVTGVDASASGNAATVYGLLASAGELGTAVGNGATAAVTSVAVGSGSNASGATSTAVGGAAEATGERSIQLGQGTNSEPKTFSVGFGESTSENYTLLKADGTIPAERMPSTVLTNTATAPTSFATGDGDAGNYASATIIGARAMTAASGGTVYGSSAKATGGGGTAIGTSASAAQNAVALGTAAKGDGLNSVALGTNSIVSGENSIGIGKGTFARGANNVVVGNEAGAGGNNSISLGFGASTNAENAMQIGTGTNLDPGTLKVGFGDSGNYRLLDSSGKIPGERLQISVGSATEPTGYADIWIE